MSKSQIEQVSSLTRASFCALLLQYFLAALLQKLVGDFFLIFAGKFGGNFGGNFAVFFC